jgi:hypothetical protein
MRLGLLLVCVFLFASACEDDDYGRDLGNRDAGVTVDASETD